MSDWQIDWAASRARLPALTQQQVLDAECARHIRRQNAGLAALVCSMMLIGSIGGYTITSAMTASIAADLAR